MWRACAVRCKISPRASTSGCSGAKPPARRFAGTFEMQFENSHELILRRKREIAAALNEGASGAEYAKLSRELAELAPVAAAIEAWRAKEKERGDLETLLTDDDVDSDMRAMAQEELRGAIEASARLAQDLRLALLPKDAADEGDVILEVRGGTGGDEAAIFAGDLFRMYSRYALARGWTVEVLSSSEGTAGGFKEIVAQVQGRGAYARLKFESGVHRVQRVPATETQGRIHTSAATVAVLPAAEEIDVEIKDDDLKVDTMRAGGAG